MSVDRRKASTKQREAYFLAFAEKIRSQVPVPLMVTGGFRSSAAMGAAISSEALDLVGLARPLAVAPDFCQQVLDNPDAVSVVRPITTGIAALDRAALMEITWYAQQLRRMGHGQPPQPDESALMSMLKTFSTHPIRSWRSRRQRG